MHGGAHPSVGVKGVVCIEVMSKSTVGPTSDQYSFTLLNIDLINFIIS